MRQRCTEIHNSAGILQDRQGLVGCSRIKPGVLSLPKIRLACQRSLGPLLTVGLYLKFEQVQIVVRRTQKDRSSKEYCPVYTYESWMIQYPSHSTLQNVTKLSFLRKEKNSGMDSSRLSVKECTKLEICGQRSICAAASLLHEGFRGLKVSVIGDRVQVIGSRVPIKSDRRYGGRSAFLGVFWSLQLFSKLAMGQLELGSGSLTQGIWPVERNVQIWVVEGFSFGARRTLL
jgi:hypothetical protein